MGKKAKDKGKEKGSKRKGLSPRSSRELPTIAEEDVSVVNNQILGFLQDLKQGLGLKQKIGFEYLGRCLFSN
ncbi:hypothetical protein PIB30_009985 [Stylosanthes scabra]|uniref:Uncharacterized protein n=1 Tax=Stylosanthes scabra TaxID=79078 RepID=A0ABU6U7W0_9FABA|nr:hypothetical protein [Stylosanthes scabra]